MWKQRVNFATEYKIKMSKIAKNGQENSSRWWEEGGAQKIVMKGGMERQAQRAWWKEKAMESEKCSKMSHDALNDGFLQCSSIWLCKKHQELPFLPNGRTGWLTLFLACMK